MIQSQLLERRVESTRRRGFVMQMRAHPSFRRVLIAMRIHDAGYDVFYDPEAAALEEAAAGVRDEFRRRIRTGAGNFHALRFTAGLLSPTAGRICFSYWSHKVFRWLVPFALPLAFAAAAGIAASDRFSGLARAFYGGCAALGL